MITDIHYGVRNDNAVFIENNKRFFRGIYFPELAKRNIERVIFLGDLLDRRKYVNFYTAKRLREDFIEPHIEMGIRLDIILGNHDVYYKNTNEVTGVEELYGYIASTGDVNIYKEAVELMMEDQTSILCVPWICDTNREHTMEMIKKSRSPACFGHLELEGFNMDRNTISLHGDDPKIFQKFDVVASGHFHTPSTKGNIKYLGSHAEFTWSDYKDDKGFHIYDTSTREFEFIENPYKMFEKLHYTDTEIDMKEVISEYDFDQLKDKYVKIVVRDRNDINLFNLFLDKVEKAQPINIQVVDDHLNLDLTEDDTIVDEAEDTLTIIKRAMATSNTAGIDINRLNTFVGNLYQEALSLE